MAKPTTDKTIGNTTDKSKNAVAVAELEYPLTSMAVVAPLVGWLIPGGGHILLKRYGRGILLLVSVVAMFLIGLGMQGRIYKPNGGDILDILGFVGDVGSGALYFLARIMDWGDVMAANAAADYGKTFLIVAGLLNFIAAADAHHIALGKSRDQLVALLGCGGVRAVRVGGVWHHAAQFDDGAGALRSLLLCPVRRWSFPRGMGDGADQTVGDVSSQFPVLSSQFSVSNFRQSSEGLILTPFLGRARLPAVPLPINKNAGFSPRGSYSSGASACRPSPGASGKWEAPPSRRRSCGENVLLYSLESMSRSRCSGVRSRMPRMARLTAWRRSGGNCLNC